MWYSSIRCGLWNSVVSGSAVANWWNCSAPTAFPQSAPPSVEVHGGVSSKGAAICGIQASDAAYGIPWYQDPQWRIGGIAAPLPRSRQSAPPSVEVHGGISGEGAAICGIQASDAAYGIPWYQDPQLRIGGIAAPLPRSRKALRPRLKCTAVLGVRALRFVVFKHPKRLMEFRGCRIRSGQLTECSAHTMCWVFRQAQIRSNY